MNVERKVALLVTASLLIGLVLYGMRRGIEANERPVTAAGGSIALPQRERTKVDVLEEYLGEKWPFVKEKLTNEQLASLAEPCSQADCPPWADIEPLIRTQIRDGLQKQREEWIHRFRDKGLPKDFREPKLNPTRRELGPIDLQRIQSKVDDANAELAPTATLAFDLLVEAEEGIWDQHRYEASPFIELGWAGVRERDGQLVILEKWRHGAWTVSYTVDSSEWPTLDAVLTEMAGIALRRDHAIEAYIASL